MKWIGEGRVPADWLALAPAVAYTVGYCTALGPYVKSYIPTNLVAHFAINWGGLGLGVGFALPTNLRHGKVVLLARLCDALAPCLGRFGSMLWPNLHLWCHYGVHQRYWVAVKEFASSYQNGYM